MRVLFCACLVLAVCVTFGCGFMPGNEKFNPETQPGEKMAQDTNELKGAQYAKLNSIGCYNIPDMRIVAANPGDFDAIDKLIREKRCFVLPTDTDIYVKERAQGDILCVKFRGSTKQFYTIKRYLASD